MKSSALTSFLGKRPDQPRFTRSRSRLVTGVALAVIVTWADSKFYGVRVAPNTEHTIQTALTLPPVIEIAIRLNEYCFGFELIALAAMLGWKLARRTRGAELMDR